jgi:flagellar hook-associated protein 1 FlgK
MSLNTILNSATQGLYASSSGIRTVTQNVANVNTPGYVRLEHTQNAREVAGRSSGVEVGALRRAADRFLEAAARQAGAGAGAQGMRATYLDQVQAAFGDPTGDGSLFARIDATLGAFESAIASPGSLSARRGALSDLAGLLSRIGQIGTDIQSARVDADRRVGSTVERVNTLLSDIATLNNEIIRAQASGDATGAYQRQSDMIDELAGLIDLRVSQRPDGSTEVRLSDGTLLAGFEAARLSLSPVEGGATAFGRITMSYGGDPTERPLEAHLKGGALRGLIDVRDRDLTEIADAVGALAGRMADALNAAHNQNASLPALAVATGRDTGLLSGDALAFTGRTTVAIVGPAGTLSRRIEVDFDAGTISVDGGPPGATGATVGAFAANLNAALGGMGSASFVNGRLEVRAAQTAPGAPGAGLVFDEPDVGGSLRGDKAFAHFFGLNDLVRVGSPSSHATGLRPTDALGFAPGSQVTMRLIDADGAIAMQRDVTLLVGTVNDALTALNDPATGFGLMGTFSLDATGQMRWNPAPGNENQTLQMIKDAAPRGGTGVSFGALFGLSQGAREARATSLSINPAIEADPRKLGFARPDLTGVALGEVAVGIGDSRGAQALFDVSGLRMDFNGPAGLSARSVTLGDYASTVAGDVGARAARAEADGTAANALKSEAEARRSNVEGVNLDEELVKLTSFQQAYAAAARMIRAADEMYEALLRAV